MENLAAREQFILEMREKVELEAKRTGLSELQVAKELTEHLMHSTQLSEKNDNQKIFNHKLHILIDELKQETGKAFSGGIKGITNPVG